MTVLKSLKETAERLTGWARPSRHDLQLAIRKRKANPYRFEDDGVIPNNPDLPLVLYRSPVRLTGDFDPAAVFVVRAERMGR